MPPIVDVLAIDEDELKIRQDLREVKHQYKETHQKYCEAKEHEQTLLREIKEQEAELERGFAAWMEEREKQTVAETEEDDESEDLLDKDERRERREYQRVIELDPKAGPFFFADKKV
jgi:septal ring factor EnvC (AmiA/AmiB activator)